MLAHEGLRQCGATVIPGCDSKPETLIQLMHDLKVNGFVGTPSMLMSLVKKAEEMGLDFRNTLTWNAPGLPARRCHRKIVKHWKITTASLQVRAIQFLKSAARLPLNARKKTGLHMSDAYVIEIVDPVTGNN